MTPPLLALVMGLGCASTNPPDLVEVHAGLLLAGASDLDPDGLHAALARVYTGEALTLAYVDHFTARARLAAEGATVKLSSMDHEGPELESSGGGWWVERMAWTEAGQVDHQGHRHLRANRYEARFVVVETPAGPRIAQTTLLRAERLERVPLSSTGEGAGEGRLQDLLRELEDAPDTAVDP